MTNAEKFKTAAERYKAFEEFCSTHDCGSIKTGKPTCPLEENTLTDGSNCKFYWLELECKEPMCQYAVQIRWIGDTAWTMIGNTHTLSLEHAEQFAKEVRENNPLASVRIVKRNVTEWEEV